MHAPQTLETGPREAGQAHLGHRFDMDGPGRGVGQHKGAEVAARQELHRRSTVAHQANSPLEHERKRRAGP